jgi:TPP-dependent pyruvate/acetoin dehydrogenase alpha subunit
MQEKSNLFKNMVLIRKFEEKILELFSLGKISGTTHTYIGQEANAVGIFSILDGDEIIFSNHRCHGHFLAYGGDPYLLAAELMGKSTGLVGGRGGSQHLQYKDFYSNGIQGGIVPVATGMAFAEKILNTKRMAIVFLGDGTFGEGVVYESLNMASLWKIPILFVVENNLYAQTTPIALALAGTISGRFSAFGIKTLELDTTDVEMIQKGAGKAVSEVKTLSAPFGLILKTYRFSAHSKGDDFRDTNEINYYKEKDPIKNYGKKLSDSKRIQIEEEVTHIIEDSFNRAQLDPDPESQY